MSADECPHGLHPTWCSGLFKRVDKNGPVPEHRPDLGPCWLWTGAISHGYGMVWTYGSRTTRRCLYVHRVVYAALVGPVATGQELDHLCRRTHCCRPSHLEPVPHRENILRGESPAARRARQNQCSKGHDLNEANTYLRPNGKGRDCRACKRTRQAEYLARRANGR